MNLKSRFEQKASRQAGFTIIEVLIASAIFTAVLMVVVFGVIGFFTTYYKTLTKSSTENTVQNISDSVEQAIRSSTASSTSLVLDNSNPTLPNPPTLGYLCAGNVEFAFVRGYEQPTEISAVIASDNDVLHEISGSCSAPTPGNAAWNSGKALLGAHYRLLTFSVTETTLSAAALWNLDIKIAYTSGGSNGAGDDLLCSPSLGSTAGGCTLVAANISQANLVSKTDIQCKPTTGSQFCDTAELRSTVVTRLN